MSDSLGLDSYTCAHDRVILVSELYRTQQYNGIRRMVTWRQGVSNYTLRVRENAYTTLPVFERILHIFEVIIVLLRRRVSQGHRPLRQEVDLGGVDLSRRWGPAAA